MDELLVRDGCEENSRIDIANAVKERFIPGRPSLVAPKIIFNKMRKST